MFFFKFGYKGFIGAIISSLLIGTIIHLSFRLIKQYDIKDYKEFLKQINGKDDKNFINKLINYIINIFLLITFYIMIAGFCAYVSQELKIPYFIGGVIISILSYITFRNNIEGIIKVNTILIPVIIGLIILFGIMNIKEINNIKNINITEGGNWILSSILYGSYNSIVLIPILIKLKGFIKNSKEALLTSIIIFWVIMLLVISIYLILMNINISLDEIELPAIYAISFMGKGFKIIYGIIILFAIFTTEVSSGYAFLTGCCTSKKMYNYLNMFICISGILISKLGFSRLINILYPLFGILGLLQIFYIIKSNFKQAIEKKG